MLRVTANSLHGMRGFPTLLAQARALCTDVQQNHRGIGEVYSELLKPSITPIACNFAYQAIDRWADSPNKLAIKCVDQDGEEHAEITYLKLIKHSHQIASFLINKAGFKPGDTIALMLGQDPAWWYSLIGLMRIGIAVVPCPRLLTPKDLLYRVNDLGIRGIITAPEYQDHVNSIRDQCPTLKTTLTTGPTGNGWHSLSDILSDCDTSIEAPKIITTTDDPCIYLYTSGTTGQPKAVRHNMDYPFFHWPTGRRWLRATQDDLIYNASDTGWGFTVWTTAAAWAMGSKLLITPAREKFKPRQMLEMLRDQKVTIFCAAPTVLRLLVADSDFDHFNFPSLRRIATVGEALDETVIRRFAERNVEVAVGFGQAETPLLIGRVDDHPHVPGTMGHSIDPYKVVVLDDTYRPLSPGSTGQIAVDLIEGSKGGIMRGYVNAAEKTKKTRSPDGRYHLTGDWATYRRDGLFVYQGRRDDLIKSRGYRIGPDEVEKAGMSHPAIAKIAVVGVRTEVGSVATTVKAFVLLKSGYKESPVLIQDIQMHIKRETGPYKYPRLIECFDLEEWEKYETTSGKIRRAGLREREEKNLILASGRDNKGMFLTP